MLQKNKIESTLEQTLFASRWLMAPMYLGLSACLVVLLIVFTNELWLLVREIPNIGVNDLILALLSLIDLSLAGNLLLIVIFSGYENFVSKMDTAEHEDQPDWKGSVDFSSLKLKLIGSIVAISGIHLLKVFMDIEKMNEDHILWMVIIHIVFVASGIMLALMDHIAVKTKKLG